METPRSVRFGISTAACLGVLLSALPCPAQVTTRSVVIQPPATAAEPRGMSRLERVNYALELAQLGAENGLQELSLTAVRRALGEGPPIASPGELSATFNTAPPGLVPTLGSGSADQGSYEQVQAAVEGQLQALSELWQKHEFPPDQVYETLVAVVLPESRPDEVFLYSQPVLMKESQRTIVYSTVSTPIELPTPRGSGELLTAWAVRAGREADLREKLMPLTENPQTEFAARVLLALLALRENKGEAVAESLADLASALKQNSSRFAAELAAHAAIPALADAEARPYALPLVEQLIINASPIISGQGSNIEVLSHLVRLAARAHFDAGHVEQGRAMLDRFLEIHTVGNQQYTGDYPLFLRKGQLGVVVFELLRAGQIDAALERLSERSDIATLRNYGMAPDSGIGPLLSRGLTQRSSEEQYELLHGFTFPGDDRRLLRVAADYLPLDAPPDMFAAALRHSAGDAPFDLLRHGIAGDLFCTGQALIDAAEDLGRLEELIDQLREPLAQQFPHARELTLLAEMKVGNHAAAETALVEITRELAETLADNREFAAYPMVTHAIAAQAARHPPLRSQAILLLETLIAYTERIQADLPRSHARWCRALALQGDDNAARDFQFAAAAPAHFAAAGWESADQHAAGSLKPVWIAQGGLIKKIAGPRQSYLYLRYPLNGEFEFSVNAQDGNWAEGNLHFGGATMAVLGDRHRVEFTRMGETESEFKVAPFARSPHLNRQTVRVGEGRAEFLLNGHPVHLDERPARPWLALNANLGRDPVFANLRLTGDPVIPREVSLCTGSDLTGWLTVRYEESRQPASEAEQQSSPVPALLRSSTPTVEYDWWAEGGTIRGRKVDDDLPRQSLLTYHRPLLEDEQLSYEFRYVPGKTVVHPALDRIAFLLEPEGVALHWLTDDDVDSTGLPADNRIVVDRDQLAAGKLPLTEGDWNLVTLTRSAGAVVIALNGVDVYTHACGIDPLSFGLFHYANRTAVEVRNATLTGDWPQTVPADLLADPASPVTAAKGNIDGRAINRIIGEKFFAEQTYEVYLACRQLPAEERFSALRAWVLPGATHSSFRTYAAATPTDPPEPVAVLTASDVERLHRARTEGRNRILIGGALVSPAEELVDAAAELQRLDELYGEIESTAPTVLSQQRSRAGLLSMISLAQDRPQEAAEWLNELFTLTKQDDPSTEHTRWIDLVAAHRAVRHPATREIAVELMDFIVTSQIENERPGPAVFASHARAIRGLGWALADDAEVTDELELTQWTPASHGTSRSQGEGHAQARWHANSGGLHHLAGHESDSVYFAVPLRGNYEINARLSALGGRDIEITAAGLYTAPDDTLDSYRIGHARFRRNNIALEQQLPPLGDWYDYRVVVEDGVSTSYVNGRVLHAETLPENPDPWIDIHCRAASTGGVRRLVITGEPRVPEEIDLLTHPDLSNWITDFYRESGQGDNAEWRFDSGTLIGRSRSQLAGRQVQSLVRYHRPLLEDGHVDYEFFYEPGESVVHPALGRLALLIGEGGVSEHWLTNAEYERSGLPAGNVAIEAEHRRGPETLSLVNGDWNSVRLEIEGDQLRLSLNGELIYERPIDAGNQRFFGLFHDEGTSEARVRNIRHRGEWPKTLPAADEQELAASTDEAM